MEDAIRKAIYKAVESEPLARTLQMKLKALEKGHSVVEMKYISEIMDNIYSRMHGGAIFALIDEAFETVGQTDGTIAVALNVNVSYITSPDNDSILTAEAKEISRTRKTAMYDIKVTDNENRLIASCNALAYRTGKPIPFL